MRANYFQVTYHYFSIFEVRNMEMRTRTTKKYKKYFGLFGP